VLANYNPSTAKVNLLSIPRDTKVLIRNSIQKVNSAYAYGRAKLFVNTISNLLQVNIQYYVCIDISVVRTIVDKLDGVDFNVPIDMNYTDRSQGLYINLKKGMQHLDGNKAEQLLRFRKPGNGVYTNMNLYNGSDLKRIETQLKFLKAIIEQKANLYYISKANDILDDVFSKLDTNMTFNDILKLASNADKLNSDSISAFKLSGDAKTQYGASYFIFNNSIINIDSSKIEASDNIIKNYFFTENTNYCNDAINYNYRTKLNNINANYIDPIHSPSVTNKPTPIKVNATPTPIITGTPIITATPTINPSNDETNITPEPTPLP